VTRSRKGHEASKQERKKERKKEEEKPSASLAGATLSHLVTKTVKR
jgi:hypothetical protein